MAIERATRQRMTEAFVGSLPLLSHDAREWAGYQFDRIADLLPEPEGQAWAAIGGYGEEAALLLLARDSLFTLTREMQPDGGFEVRVVSHPVKITEIRYRRDEQQTFWDFKFRSRDALPIEGRINLRARPEEQETFDQPETLARALARLAGWGT